MDDPRALTWIRRSGIAGWTLELSGPPTDDLHQWLRDTAVSAAGLLEGFALPSEVRLSTFSRGDIEPLTGDDDQQPRLEVALAAHPDLKAVQFSLDLLLVTELPGPARPLPHSAYFLVELMTDDPPPYLLLYLSIDVDIYAEITGARNRDNRVLAAHNGPRLTGFGRCQWLSTREGRYHRAVAPLVALPWRTDSAPPVSRPSHGGG